MRFEITKNETKTFNALLAIDFYHLQACRTKQ